MSKRRFLIDFGRTPDHALDYLLGMLQDVRVTTLQRIDKISTHELHWQFRDGWNTIGALLAHITALEHYFRIVYIERRPLTEVENERWLPALDLGPWLPKLITHQLVETYIAGLEEARRLMLDALQSVTFEQLAARINDYDPKTGCNLAWVLYHMVEDEVHHRGQISILRKLYKEQG